MRHHSVYVEDRHGRVGDRLRAMADRVADSVEETIAPDAIETFDALPIVLVTTALPKRRDLTVLLPQGQRRFRSLPALSAQHSPVYRVLVPIGNGPSGLRAFEEALSVIEFPSRVSAWELHCYHTTWRRDGVDSDDPKDHMDQGALDNLAARESILRRRYMDSEVLFPVLKDHLEIQAPSVVDGIIRTALKIKAAVIVMARGDDLLLGSYVDQMVDVCPVPLLIVAQQES